MASSPDGRDNGRPGNFWSRRSIIGKIGVVLGGLIGLLILLAVVSGPEESGNQPDVAQEQPADADQTPTNEPAKTATPETTPEPPEPTPEPTPEAPAARQLSGDGAQVENLRLEADSPLVVTGTHQGQGNFIVELIGRGSTSGTHFLYNEIGAYQGETAVADAGEGRYRVRVEADGPWTLTFEQPVPTSRAKTLPGRLRGDGAEVVPVSVTRDLQPVIEATHRGEGNFIAEVIGYGDLSGTEFLFNEIGTYEGETLLEDLPAGAYLLHVQADGPWTMRFSR